MSLSINRSQPDLPSVSKCPVTWNDETAEESAVENCGATPAIPAIRAVPAVPASHDSQPATRAVRATPATPAIPPEHETVTEPVVDENDTPVVEKVKVRRNSLRRAEFAYPHSVNFGQITSDQWALVKEYKDGVLTADNLKSQFLELEKTKLDILVEKGKISVEEENRRIARFSGIVDNLIRNFS